MNVQFPLNCNSKYLTHISIQPSKSESWSPPVQPEASVGRLHKRNSPCGLTRQFFSCEHTARVEARKARPPLLFTSEPAHSQAHHSLRGLTNLTSSADLSEERGDMVKARFKTLLVNQPILKNIKKRFDLNFGRTGLTKYCGYRSAGLPVYLKWVQMVKYIF